MRVAVARWGLAILLPCAFLIGYLIGISHRYDVNRDGVVNVLDVQAVVNAFLDGQR